MRSDLSANLTVIVPGDPDQRTGGYLFDARIVNELRTAGWTVSVVGLDGRFPDADDQARTSLDEALAALPAGAQVLIDGLALGGVPEVAERHAGRLRIHALIHHPLADETGLSLEHQRRLLSSERRALAACRQVVVTSPFTARRLRELDLLATPATVVEPGVDPAALAEPVRLRLAGDPCAPGPLLCVASLTPRKGQDVLIEALVPFRGQEWILELAGSPARDSGFARQIAALIKDRGLEQQVRLLGELGQEALNAAYARAAVLVVPSHYEGYGMVVTEALARGLPLIATRGGALAETVPPQCSLQVASGDVAALSEALGRWLNEPELREALSRQALEQRQHLPDWAESGRRMAGALAS